MISDYAKKHGRAVAIRAREGECTYRELDELSNAMANCLVGLGIGVDSVVALVARRSTGAVVGLLGILKAGAAVLPIDPDLPDQRKTMMLREARVKIAVREGDQTSDDNGKGIISLGLAQLTALPSGRLDGRSKSGVHREDLACVMFTSGSTGTPKGVAKTHGALADYLVSLTRTHHIEPSDRVLSVTSLAFDGALRDVLAPLIVGASVVMPNAADIRNPARCLDTIIHQEVTRILSGTPTFLGEVCRLAEMRHLKGSRLSSVLTNGEALPGKVVRQIRSCFGNQVSVFNQYGPTEYTMIATVYEATNDRSESVPIGHPIENVKVYVLDSVLEPVPVGVTGELYIAGGGLARGYINRPDWTAERFIADPFGSPGSRMYRSGDLVRWRTDGQLEFLGRADRQVNVRGFRIELDEVELAIRSHPNLSQAAVSVAEGRNGVMRLVADIIKVDGATVNGVTLRNYLSERLPAYMIPASFRFVPGLPITLNGKLDRKALAAIDSPFVASCGRNARTRKEEVLCSLFAEVLGVKEVSIDDDFFDLGGDSLSAVQLMCLVRLTLDIELSAQLLYKLPTVAGISEAGFLGKGKCFSQLIVLRHGGEKPPLFFFPPLLGTSLVYRSLAEMLGKTHSLYGFEMVPGRLPADITEMTNNYLDIVRTMQASYPYNLIGWSFGGLIAYEMACIIANAGDDVGLLAMLDCYPTPSQSIGVITLEQARMTVSDELSRSDMNYTRRSRVAKSDSGERKLTNPDLVQACAEVYMNNLRLRTTFAPSVYKGDMVLFVAKHRTSEPPIDAWAPLVKGRISVEYIECSHASMCDSIPASRIAEIIKKNVEGQ